MMHRLLRATAIFCAVALGTLHLTAGAREPSTLIDQFNTIEGYEVPQLPFGMLRWYPESTFFLDGAGCSRPRLLQVTALSSPDPGHVNLDADREFTGGVHRFHDLDALVQAVSWRSGLARYEIDGEKAYVFLRVDEQHGNQRYEFKLADRIDMPEAGDRTVSGFGIQENFCGHGQAAAKMYWHIQFDQPIAAADTWEWIKRKDGQIKERKEYLRLTFDLPAEPTIEHDGRKRRLLHYKVGISWTKPENAELNLKAEIPHWDLVKLQHEAATIWREHIDRLALNEAPDWLCEHTAKNLNKVLRHPNIFSDVGGEFLGFDGKVHQAKEGETVYHIFSSWDTYRTHMPLVALLWPEVASNIAQTFVYQANTGRGGFARWSIANQETGTMMGDPSAIMIGTAYAFGARDFDAAAALTAMIRSASTPGLESSPGYHTRPGLAQYLTEGFTKFNPTVDYSRSDFAIARMAHQLGEQATAEKFLRQANNFKSLADEQQMRLAARDYDNDPIKQQKYHGTNGEGWDFQYQFHPWHNLPFIWQAHGGRAWAEKKLDAHVHKFLPPEYRTYDPRGDHAPHFAEWASGDHEVVFHIHNEHGFHTPLLYNWLGKPWKTQALCRTVFMEGFTKPAGDDKGYSWTRPGQEDLGTMNSWSIWLTLGIYPSLLGEPGVSIGSPLIPRVTFPLGGCGKSVTLVAHDASVDKPYIQEMSVNGKPHNSSWLPFAKLDKQENTIEFWMAAEPNKDWGGEPPPAFDANPLYKDVQHEDLLPYPASAPAKPAP